MPTPALATTRTPVPVPQPATTPARRVGTSTVEPRIAPAGPPVVRLLRMTTPATRSVTPRADTSHPSRTGPVAQPASSVISAQPATGRTERRPPTMGSPAFDALQVVNNRARQNSGANSTFLGRIAAAPRSPAQAEALTQAQLINDDCSRSESQVSRIAAARRQQVSTYFSGARQGLSDFFTRSVTAVQAFITGKQAEIIGAVTRALAWVRTAITNTLQAVQTIAGQIRARINQMLETISTSVQSRVEGIAGQITGLIDSIPLPDIPGIGRIRAGAVSLLNRAAGLVKVAFGLLVDFVGWAFNAGMDLLDSVLSTITSLVDTALSLASSAILSVLQMIGQALNQAVALIGATLRGALLAVIIPILNSVEGLIARLIGSAEQSALGLLRRNRNEYLSSLVEAVTPGATPQGSQAASTESQIAILRQLGRDAAQNSQMIVQVFDALTSGNLASIIRTLASAAARTVVSVAAFLAQVIRAIVTVVTQALQILTQVAQTIGNFLRELIQSFITWVGSLVENMRSLVQRGADQLIRFAQSGLSRIGSFIRRFVQNLILGRSISDSLTDALGEFNLTQTFSPTPVSFLGPAPAFVGAPPAFLIVIIAGVVYITILGLSFTLPLWLAIAIVVVVILLLILLIYLLYRWLTRPRPPKPPPCKIETRTLLPAPDGTADTRKIVGVKERVEMTASSPVTWSALHGTIAPTSPTTAIWTAPATGVITTVKATLAIGKQCLRLMTVKAPDGLTMIKKAKKDAIPSGTAGACMFTDVTIHPRSVCLGATQWLEVPGPATNVKGFFTKFPPSQLFHNPNPNYLPFNDNNTGLEDHAAFHAVPGPFLDGQFQWDIPNKYKVDGEPDSSGRLFTKTTQLFTMDSSGTMTISKAGAFVSRKITDTT